MLWVERLTTALLLLALLMLLVAAACQVGAWWNLRKVRR